VLVVTGAGGDFCAGADLGGGRPDRSMAGLRARMRRVGEAALALHRLTKPTVAAVDGAAAGAGMNLALGCDCYFPLAGQVFTARTKKEAICARVTGWSGQ